MPRFSPDRLQGSLVFILLLIAPLLGIVDLFPFLGSGDIIIGIDLWKIKISKDIIILMAIIVVFFSRKIGAFPISNISLTIFFGVTFLSVILSLVNTSLESIAAGLRWILPFVFYLTLRPQLNYYYIDLSRLLYALLIIGIALQVYQYYFMVGIYGLNEFNFNIRNPGFFLVPSSMAAYSMATLYFITRYESKNMLRIIAFFLTFVSIGLTSSGTGLMSFFLFLLFFSLDNIKYRLILLVSAILVGILVYALLPILTNREDIYLSPLARIEVIMQAFDFSRILYSNTFGAGTNTLINLNTDYLDTGQALIADSMIGSTLVNLGLLFLLMMLYNLFIIPLYKLTQPGLLYLSAFFPFFASINTFELFPVNILMFVALSNLIVKRRLNSKIYSVNLT